MQANRDRFERKQLLQVFREPDYDSSLLSASKTEQAETESISSYDQRYARQEASQVRQKDIICFQVENYPAT